MYDDFVMKMYGKNALYDLANGGGKSVLMLLLMQCLIPNCTLDEKQPIEKLFRDHVNNVIHSLIEWKVDAADVTDGMRYMVTGFAAKEASAGQDNDTISDSENFASNENKKENSTTSIEYFNYVIFYQNYNKNDIVNLPLVKNDERITYRGLRNYLSDLAHKEKNLKVFIFDRKGEYQKFISGYGLHDSQWEIIRGINQTEGHVRQYFESHFRTTRKIVEDLLIEEIIEKASASATVSGKHTAENTAELLMSIEGQLKELAEKEKGIRTFDHETELIQLFTDRIQSFMELYKEEEKTANGFADIYVTLQAIEKRFTEEKKCLSEKLYEVKLRIAETEKKIDLLKLTEDIADVEKKQAELLNANEELKKINEEKEKQDARLSKAEAVKEFFSILEDMNQLNHIKAASDINGNTEKDIAVIVYNLYLKKEEKKKNFILKMEEAEKEKNEISEKLSKKEELLNEIEKRKYVLSELSEERDKEKQKYSELLEEYLSELSERKFRPTSEMISECQKRLSENEQKREKLKDDIENAEKAVNDNEAFLKEKQYEAFTVEEEYSERVNNSEIRNNIAEKISKLAEVYHKESDGKDKLITCIQKKIDSDIELSYEIRKRIKSLQYMYSRFTDGISSIPGESAKKVMDYLMTRHGADVIYGADYLAELNDEQREKFISKNPDIPYGIVVKNADSFLQDAGLFSMDLSDEVIIYDRDNLLDSEKISDSGKIVVRTSAREYLDGSCLKRRIARSEAELANLAEELRTRDEMIRSEREDLTFVINHPEEEYLNQQDKERKLKHELEHAKKLVEDSEENLQMKEKLLNSRKDELVKTENQINILKKENDVLQNVSLLENSINEIELKNDNSKKEYDLILKHQKEYENEIGSLETYKENALEKVDALRTNISENDVLWKENYAPYLTDGRYDVLDESEEVLKQEFSIILRGGEAAQNVEQGKILASTLERNILSGEERIRAFGMSPDVILKEYNSGVLKELLPSEIEAIRAKSKKAADNMRVAAEKSAKLEKDYERKSGSVEFEERQLKEKYGEKIISELEDLKTSFTNINNERTDFETKDVRGDGSSCKFIIGEKLVKQLDTQKEVLRRTIDEKENVESCLRTAEASERDISDTLSIAEHVMKQNSLDMDDGREISSTLPDIKNQFDELLLQYDRIGKSLDRAKNDSLKVKSMVIETLSEMGVQELASSIRDEAEIPCNRKEAEDLVERLIAMQDLICLERDRIKTSLKGMEELKGHFVDSCIERCLNVRTLIGRLPGLSEIKMGNEKVEMVHLSIPYVKDEFMKERMSSYIDRVIEEADAKNTESERQKQLNYSLSLKKLFSVIVTDMSKIQLKLYKRENCRGKPLLKI